MSVISLLDWHKRQCRIYQAEQKNGLINTTNVAKALISDYIMEKGLSELRIELSNNIDIQLRILLSSSDMDIADEKIIFYGDYKTHLSGLIVVFANSNIKAISNLNGQKSMDSISFIKACQNFIDRYAKYKAGHQV